MADKKLTTEEILARARNQAAGGKPADAEPAPPQPAAEAPAASPAAPKSTADILAAARAQAAAKAASSGEAPAASEAPAAPAAAPKSTADILAAARAQAAAKAAGGAAPAPAAAPKSTADILAAARAQKGASGATPAAKPAAPAAAAKSAAPAAASGVGVKEMVAAVKEAQQAGKPVAPKLPAQPAKPKLPVKEQKVTRRSFWQMLSSVTISPFAVAWTVMATIGGVWSLAAARFLMPNMVRELPSKFKVGAISDYPPNAVSEKYTASRGVWIVNTDQYNGQPLLYSLLAICTHLGCTPSWLSGEQKFKCPCHGSGFYITGINFEGPAPRPLERVGLTLGADGLLEVDKSLKFQEELGQWSDPKSYVELG